MSADKQYQVYKNNAVNTATSGDLTLMLYNGCIRFIRQAIKDLSDQNYEEKNTHIQKSQDIIQELMLTLDPKIELSRQMMPLYEYMNYQLTEGNIKNEPALLEEALSYAIEFRDTWKEVVLKTRKTQHATKGAQV